MVQIKHFTAPLKMPSFRFSRHANWPGRDKILSAPQRGQNIIKCESKQTYFSYSFSSLSLARVSVKIIFHAKLSGRFLLRLRLKLQFYAQKSTL